MPRRRKPLNSDAAIADGVDYLLREYRTLPKLIPKPSEVDPDNQFGGPIENSLLIASKNAPIELKRVADYVCNREEDDLEINAAAAYLKSQYPFGGEIRLSGGYFDLAGPLTLSAGISIVGAGMFATQFWFESGVWSVSDYAITTNNDTVFLEAFTQPRIANLSFVLGPATILKGLVRAAGGCLVENVAFDEFSATDAVVVETSDDSEGVSQSVTVRGCRFTMSSSASPPSNSCVKIIDSGVSQTVHAVIENNSMAGSKYGVYSEAENSMILNNRINFLDDVVGATGIYVERQGSIVQGNFVSGVDGGATSGDDFGIDINVESGEWVSVINNTIQDMDTAIRVGSTDSTGGDALISDNTIIGAATGIELKDDLVDVTLRSNHIDSTTTTPVSNITTTLNSLIEDYEIETWADSRTTLAAATGAQPFPYTGSGTVVDVRAVVGTAPTGQALVVDVHINGSSLWAATIDKPTIAVSAKDSGLTPPDQNAVLSDGDVITVDIDQVGSTIAGGNLTVVVRIRPHF